MKINFIIAVSTSFFVAGCNPVAKLKLLEQPGTPVSLSALQISAVQREVRSNLKDPESARFGAIAASRSESGKYAVCGFVNGRNSYGGYMGMQPYAGTLVTVASQNSFLIYSFNDGEIHNPWITRAYCRNSGVNLF